MYAMPVAILIGHAASNVLPEVAYNLVPAAFMPNSAVFLFVVILTDYPMP